MAYSYMTAIEILKYLPNVKLLAGSSRTAGVHAPPTPSGYIRVSSTRRNTADLHGAGLALDLSAPMTNVGLRSMRLTAAWLYGFSGQSLELIHKVGSGGYFVKNGRRVGSGYYGSATVNAHANHVHWAISASTAQRLLANLRARFGPPGGTTPAADDFPSPAAFWGMQIGSPSLYYGTRAAGDLLKQGYQLADNVADTREELAAIKAALTRIEDNLR